MGVQTEAASQANCQAYWWKGFGVSPNESTLSAGIVPIGDGGQHCDR
jgi:hypothetical protein